MQKPTGELRIIGGKWRSRKIPVIDEIGLRPTPDRVRETVFNWLSNDIIDARCLDLFSGTGAMGFEALSRGAKEVIFVDKSRQVIAQLKKTATQLGVGKEARFICAEVLPWLQTTNLQSPLFIFDIVFLDPPFHQNFLPAILKQFKLNKGLHEGSVIYIESEKKTDITEPDLVLPKNFAFVKTKIAGEVCYQLARVSA